MGKETLLFIILGIIIIYVIAKINSFIVLKRNVERSKSSIDVFLKKRYDLIPSLVQCVKEYCKYESSVLKDIKSLRKTFLNGNEESALKLNNEYVKLVALAENYPDLKASDNFLQLQKSLSKIESELQASRRIYIIDITKYNTKIKQVPGIIISSLMGYTEIKYPEYIIDDVKVDFSKKD